MATRKHYLSETYDLYEKHLKLTQDTTKNAWERSLALGVVCHFLGDYFCKYHAKKPYTFSGLYLHLMYELKLHIKVIMALCLKGIRCDHFLPDLNSFDNQKSEVADCVVATERKEAGRFIEGDSLLVAMIEDYLVKVE